MVNMNNIELEKVDNISIWDYISFVEKIFLRKIILNPIKEKELLLIEKDIDYIFKIAKVDNSIKEKMSNAEKKLLILYSEYIWKASEVYFWESLFLIIEWNIKNKDISRDYKELSNILKGFINRYNRITEENRELQIIYPNIDRAIINIIKYVFENNEKDFIEKDFEDFFSSVLKYIIDYNDSIFIGYFIVLKDKLFYDIINYVRINDLYKTNKILKDFFRTINKQTQDFDVDWKVSKKTKDELEKINKLFYNERKDEILDKQLKRVEAYIKEHKKIKETIKKDIIWQEKIIDQVFEKINKTILSISNRPTVLFMAWHSGLWKTQLWKEIAKTFGSSPLIYNLWHFYDSHTMASLLWAPAWYVGYDDENMLEKYIKDIDKKKISDKDNKYPIHPVIIFDEVEKANWRIQNAFLELFDEWKLTLLTWKTIDLKDAIIILTSNVWVKTNNNIWFWITSDEEEREISKNEVQQGISNLLRPEIINRIDDFYIFEKLEKNNIKDIKTRKIELFLERIKENKLLQKLNFDINNKEIKKIITKWLKWIDLDIKNIRNIEKKIEEIITNYFLN